MTIFRAGLGDADEIKALVYRVSDQDIRPHFDKAGWQFYLGTIEPSVDAALTDPSFYAIKLIDNKQTVGFAAIRQGNYITQLFVDKSVQGKGLGKQLMHQLFTTTSSPYIELKSSVNAVNFYQHFGFAIVGEESCHNGIRYVPMKKTLSPNLT